MVERRKYPRIHIHGAVPVLDLDRNLVMGQLVDLSEDGMMTLCPESVDIQVNRLYQVQIDVPAASPATVLAFAVECLWREPGHEAATHWAGFKIIDIARDDAATLRQLLQVES